MSELEKRVQRVMSSLAGNEAIAGSLKDDAAGELLSWGYSMAERIVEDTRGVDDETAEKQMEPRLRALRLLLRAVGRWAGERNTLDYEARRALWDRAGEQARILFGEHFEFPPMDQVVEQLPEGADARQVIAWLKTYFEEKRSMG